MRERAADVAGQFCADAHGIVSDRGAVLKTIGDAVMVRFPIAADAIAGGLRIASELGGEHSAPIIRVGMHHGTAVEHDGDWFGLAVNVAARVAALAAGGEVLLTDATRRAAGALDGITSPRHAPPAQRERSDRGAAGRYDGDVREGARRRSGLPHGGRPRASRRVAGARGPRVPLLLARAREPLRLRTRAVHSRHIDRGPRPFT